MASRKREGAGKSEGEGATKAALEAARPDRSHAREDRVQECMRIMRAGEWETGVTGGELAVKWGVTPGNVEHVAGEASRRVLAVVQDRPGLQVYAVSKLKEAADASMAAAPISEEPHKERGVAVRALSELLKFADGVRDVFIGSPGWIVLSPERRRELVDQAKARIAEAEAWIAKNDSKPKELKR